MAGSITVTITKKDVVWDNGKGFVEVKIDWTAAADGSLTPAAIVTTSQYNSYLAGRFCGLAETVPDGTTAPTTLYGITILNANGVDMMGGQLMDRSATAGEQAVPKIGDVYGAILCSGPWSFNLANNSVNAAKGTCYLFFI